MKNSTQKVLLKFDDIYDLLNSLESIIKITQKACLNKEISSVYYNLTYNDRVILSEERNHYINMLSIALDKLSSLKDKNFIIEKEISCLK